MKTTATASTAMKTTATAAAVETATTATAAMPATAALRKCRRCTHQCHQRDKCKYEFYKGGILHLCTLHRMPGSRGQLRQVPGDRTPI
jgi:hypothetical protein